MPSGFSLQLQLLYPWNRETCLTGLLVPLTCSDVALLALQDKLVTVSSVANAGQWAACDFTKTSLLFIRTCVVSDLQLPVLMTCLGQIGKLVLEWSNCFITLQNKLTTFLQSVRQNQLEWAFMLALNKDESKSLQIGSQSLQTEPGSLFDCMDCPLSRRSKAPRGLWNGWVDFQLASASTLHKFEGHHLSLISSKIRFKPDDRVRISSPRPEVPHHIDSNESFRVFLAINL